MSPTRRTAAPRKRPASTAGHASPRNVVGEQAPVEASKAAGGQDGDSAIREKVLSRFTAAVQARTDLDEEGREALIRHYAQAIESAELAPKLKAPDRGEWVAMLNLMVEQGMLEEADARDLIHGFDDAFEVFKSRETQHLLEFAQRCERDGQEQAVEWLESQRAAEEESRRATGSEIPAAAQQVSKARVRRSRPARGPPV